MGQKCIVCGTRSKKYSFHSIPIAHYENRQEWFAFLEKHLSTVDLVQAETSPRSYVCSQHFKTDTDFAFGSTGKYYLKKSAIPSVYTKPLVEKEGNNLQIQTLVNTESKNTNAGSNTEGICTRISPVIENISITSEAKDVDKHKSPESRSPIQSQQTFKRVISQYTQTNETDEYFKVISTQDVDLNPYFTQDIDDICAICTKTLARKWMQSLYKDVHPKKQMKAYQVLESVSMFALKDNGPQFICDTCFKNTLNVYRFQQMCNKSQSFFLSYLKQKEDVPYLLNDGSEDEEYVTEEIHIQFDEEMSNEECDSGNIEEHDTDVVDDYSPQEVKYEETKKNKLTSKRILLCKQILNADNITVPQRNVFSCRTCLKSFRSKANLKKHSDLECRKKKFICEYCAKRFGEKGNLKKHLVSHTGEKPFECHLCEKKFTQKPNWTRHYQTNHPDAARLEEAFKCAHCPRKFSTKEKFNRHCIIHSGVKPNVCSLCGLGFDLYLDMKLHRQSHKDDYIMMNCDDSVKEL